MEWPSLIQLVSFQQFLWLSVTVLVYVLAVWIFRSSAYNVLLHPIVVGAILIAGIVAISTTPFQDYLLFANPINWMLGPVTVALAIPLYQQIKLIYAAGRKGLFVILLGGCVAPLLAISWLSLFDFLQPVKLSVLTKSITTPLAVETTDIIGGLPELAAGVVVLTGILGVVFSQFVFKLTRCVDSRAQGIALGTVSHAIGTARAHQLDAKSGAFATMALCVNGILTAIFIPLVFLLFA